MMGPGGGAMKRKREGAYRRGESHPNHRLRERDVLEIVTSGESSAALARELGVSRECISDIRNGRRWRWLVGKREQY